MKIKIKKFKVGLHGRYLRKAGEYDPEDAWHRKWTYKVGWKGGGDNIRLVAMTDGMVCYKLTPENLVEWINDNNMVLADKGDMVDFIWFTGGIW